MSSQNLSHRNSLWGNSNQISVPMKSIPIQVEKPKSRVNAFSTRSFSTQECIPCSTSSDLTKTLKNMCKERVKSPNWSGQNVINRRMSINTLYTATNGHENQSVASWNQVYWNNAEINKKYKIKSKRYHRKYKKLEQINKQLEFKVKFFEDKNNKLIEEISKI